MEKKEYIERGALDTELQNLVREYNRNCESDKSSGAFEALYRLRLFPAADVVEVVHGEWCWEGKFKACSKCGSYVEWNETLGANFWKYCPFCGAKMDGGNRNADA